MSYGGWTQGRALGARIASIVRSREELHTEEGEDNNDFTQSSSKGIRSSGKYKRKPRRHRIIIHSSPFVRCIQTSIAISAGIGQTYRPYAHTGELPEHRVESQSSSGEARSNSPSSDRESLGSAAPSVPDHTTPPPKLHIATLRIDAFLGEWLSPDYYKDITPPPSSVMMVAGAKSELLRPSEKIAGLDLSNSMTQGNFPGGWKSSLDESSIDDSSSKSALGSMSAIRQALPYRSRAHTDSQGDSASSNVHRNNVKLATANNSDPMAYVPPTPAYALSPSDPIPRGYSAHARDACVDVDYRWDSMREPYDWGDGGEYGEEWSSMHRRFRTGIHRMICYYENQSQTPGTEEISNAAEEDTDTVLILVTHGAGCNALIGALTNQPVLLDVGMASLTMAIRKDEQGERVVQSPLSSIQRRRGSFDSGLAKAYDVKITASSEHLRVGPSSLASPSRSPASRVSPTIPPSSRRPLGSVSSTDGFTIGEPLVSKPIAINGGNRGPSSTASSLRWAFNSNNLRSGSGLWGSPATQASDATSDSNDDHMPNFGHAGIDGAMYETRDSPKTTDGNNDRNNDGPMTSPSRPLQRTSSQRGLWGDQAVQDLVADEHEDTFDEDDMVSHRSGSLPGPKRTLSRRGLWSNGDIMPHEMGPKRRWTVTREHA